jgi:GT2 family glycosyltransferase
VSGASELRPTGPEAVGSPRRVPPGERVSVSVVVCTHNRASLLAPCIDAVGREVEGNRDAEIIVVDSGSTDNTREAVAELAERWPRLRYERVDVPGLSLARNRGIDVARNDVVAFLDDDAEPCPGWLEALVAAYDDPEVAAAGGRAHLVWEGPTPRWLPHDQDSFFSGLDLGPEGRFFGPGENPYGVNMSVRKEWALAVGGFDPQLGRTGSNLISNEELGFFSRLAGLGGRCWYAPGSAVLHHVSPERVSLRWLLRRAWAQGRSDLIAKRTLLPDAGNLGVRAHRPKQNLARWRRIARQALRRPGADGEPVAPLVVSEIVRYAEFGGAVYEALVHGRGPSPEAGTPVVTGGDGPRPAEQETEE